MRPSCTPCKSPGGGIETSDQRAVDWETLLVFIDGDKAFASELVESYVGTGDKALALIAAALTTGDHSTMRDAAHVLKGASANLRASAATSAACELEAAVISGHATEIPGLVEKLMAEIRRTMEYLQLKVA